MAINISAQEVRELEVALASAVKTAGREQAADKVKQGLVSRMRSLVSRMSVSRLHRTAPHAAPGILEPTAPHR